MLNIHASVYVISSMHFILYYIHGDRFPRLLAVMAHPLHQDEGWGRDSVVSDLTLQHGPQWDMKQSDRGNITLWMAREK